MKDNVSGCSVEEAMRLLGGRWRLLLVSYLLEGPSGSTHCAAPFRPFRSAC